MVPHAVFIEEAQTMEGTLYRICRSMGISDADSCDAVQEALLNAWQARQRIDTDRFRAYLTRILINKSVEAAGLAAPLLFRPYQPPGHHNHGGCLHSFQQKKDGAKPWLFLFF